MKLTICKKVLYGMASLVVITFISSMVNLKISKDNLHELEVIQVEMEDELLYGEFSTKLTLLNLGYMDAIVDKDSKMIDSDIVENHTEFYSWFKKIEPQYRRSIEGSPHLDAWDKSIEQIKNLEKVGEKLFGLVRNGADLEAYAAIDDVLDGAVDDILGRHKLVVNDLSEQFHKELKAAVAENKLGLQFSIWSFIVSLLLGIGIGGYLYKDINSKLTGIAKKIDQASKNLNTVSKTINENSTELSSSTTEQAASVQQTAASVNQINAMVLRNAESAKQSENISAQSIQAAENGTSIVEQMNEAIESISDSNKSIMSEIDRSNQQFSEISRIIEEINNKTRVINDIVFQTKLLSFNASVEAARAGEHGKGFAVVAEEIGKLATMSGSAADEIGNMLAGSISKVDSIIQSTQASVGSLVEGALSRVSTGVEIGKECHKSFIDIRENVVNVNQRIVEISTASSEQSAGINEINNAISQLDQVTQLNANAATEVADVAEQMSDQSNQLNHVSNELLEMIGVTAAHTANMGNVKKVSPAKGVFRTVFKKSA